MSDFLSRLAGSALGGLLGRGGGMAGGIGGAVLGAALAHLMNSRAGAGGLSDLVDRVRNAGLGHHADSWVSSGSNQPIAPHRTWSACSGPASSTAGASRRAWTAAAWPEC